MSEYNIKKIPAIVGRQSLVGTCGEKYPFSYGNYFSFHDPMGGPVLRCVNMWSENMEEATKRFLPDGEIECIVIHTERQSYAVVVDKRIPQEWCLNRPYFCGCYAMPKDILEPLCDYMGWDKYGRAMEYLNPEEYYKQNNMSYNKETGIVKQTIEAESRTLKANFSVELAEDEECLFGVDLEEELANILKEEIEVEMQKEYGLDWRAKQDFDIIQELIKLANDDNNNTR